VNCITRARPDFSRGAAGALFKFLWNGILPMIRRGDLREISTVNPEPLDSYLMGIDGSARDADIAGQFHWSSQGVILRL
jgi:hypothetical protein